MIRNPLVGLGKDAEATVVANQRGKMPHLLVAGATGSTLNRVSLTPSCLIHDASYSDEVRMMLVDPSGWS